MLYAFNDEAYIKLAWSIFITELERLEAETVTFIVVMGVEHRYPRNAIKHQNVQKTLL